MANWYGTLGPVELPVDLDWDSRNGANFVRTFRGAIGQLDTLMAQAQAKGLRYRYTAEKDGGYATLVVDSATIDAIETPINPTDVPLTEQWNLIGNDMEKSVWTHWKVKAGMYGWTEAETAFFRRNVRDFIDGTLTDCGAGQDPANCNPIGNIDYVVPEVLAPHPLYTNDERRQWLKDMIRELAQGDEFYTVSQYVLRHIRIVGRNYSVKPDYTYVGSIITTASMRTIENVQEIMFTLPDGYWLKKTPTVEQVATDKWQISQEWWHADAYSVLKYGAPI